MSKKIYDALVNQSAVKPLFVSRLKTVLLTSNWANAIDLVAAMERHQANEFSLWLASGSTIKLREIAEHWRKSSLYWQRNDPLPFENDIQAIDSAWLSSYK